MCPNCKQTLIILELEGIEIDYCTECGGAWLDEGEMELIMEIEGVDSAALADEIFTKKLDSKSEKRCVRCAAKMQMVRIGDPPVEVDRCPLGDGVWFDKGEMQTLIRNQHQDANGVVAKFFADLVQAEAEENTKGDS